METVMRESSHVYWNGNGRKILLLIISLLSYKIQPRQNIIEIIGCCTSFNLFNAILWFDTRVCALMSPLLSKCTLNLHALYTLRAFREHIAFVTTIENKLIFFACVDPFSSIVRWAGKRLNHSAIRFRNLVWPLLGYDPCI